jgi:23S rRNA (uracil1939-C5)-methyltransferase
VVSRLRESGTRALSPGDVVDLAVTDLLANGQGVGRASGVVVFVWGPLPGERARARITLVKAKYAVAELVELLERSEDRAAPFCRVFGACGGCQVQHLAYPAQLEWKRTMIVSALRRIGGIRDAQVSLPCGMREPRGYRNKMALVVRSRPDIGAEFGFYQARSHDIVAIDGCPIVQPQLERAIAGLREAAREPETEAAFAGARHVVARVGRASKDVVVSIVTERPSGTLPALAPALLRALPGAVGIANSYDPASTNAVLGRRSVTLAGRPEIEEEIGGVRFRVSAGSFFQINGEMVGAIFDFLEMGLPQGLRVLDLYCGAGTFALFFARHGAAVVGIEENPDAVREARANAERNALATATFFAGRVERMVRSGPTARALSSADVVFLDPPRKGSDEVTIGAIARVRVPHVWYLSCNPATLARDLAQFVAAGYGLDLVQPFDMFPQTGHVEALAVLRRPEVPAVGFGR